MAGDSGRAKPRVVSSTASLRPRPGLIALFALSTLVLACGGQDTSPEPGPATSRPGATTGGSGGNNAPARVDALSAGAADAGTTDLPPAVIDAAGPVDLGPGTPVDAEGAASRDAGKDATVDADPSDAAATGPLHLESTGFLAKGADLIFPKSASYPDDQSPAFSFAGVPAGAKSLALTFVDQSIGAVKWVVWDIPPGTPGLPGNLSKTPHPAELPTSTQRGSLGRTGYSGPGVKGPPLHTYEFQLYALDVEQLPGTQGADTVTVRSKLLAAHTLAKSPVFVAKGQLGGP